MCQYPNPTSASCGRRSGGAASSARSIAPSSLKYVHQSAALSASARSATSTRPASSSRPAAPAPMTTTDSPSATITTSPCRSTKCPTVDDEALHAREPRRDPEHRRGERPQDPLRLAAERAADEHDARGGDVEGDDAEDRGHLGHRCSFRVHAGVQHGHDEPAEGEREAVSLEGARRRECDHEEPAHPAEQQEPVAHSVGRDCVREPGVRVVHPPDQVEHDDDLSHRGRVTALDEHAGQLRDREDEDEVEEELERRDANRALRRSGHAPNHLLASPPARAPPARTAAPRRGVRLSGGRR